MIYYFKAIAAMEAVFFWQMQMILSKYIYCIVVFLGAGHWLVAHREAMEGRHRDLRRRTTRPDGASSCPGSTLDRPFLVGKAFKSRCMWWWIPMVDHRCVCLAQGCQTHFRLRAITYQMLLSRRPTKKKTFLYDWRCTVYTAFKCIIAIIKLGIYCQYTVYV